MAIPSNTGPIWLRRERGHRTQAVPLPAGAQEISSLAGAIALREAVIVPVLANDRIMFAAWRFRSQAWSLVEIEGTPAVPGGSAFAAPVSNGDEAYWVGADGLLLANQDGDEITGELVPWPAGFVAQLAVRPLVLQDGSFHVLGRIGEDRLVYQTMLPGDAKPMQRDGRGYALSYGPGVFREGKRLRQPWDREWRGDYVLADGEFLLPLLAFEDRTFLVAFCSHRATLRQFFDPTATPMPRRCTLAICGSTRLRTDLGRTMDVSAAWELVPFVHAGRLFVYSASENHCWSWALRPAAGATG